MTFNPLRFLRCLLDGHRWRNSKTRPGYQTCERCGLRTKY